MVPFLSSVVFVVAVVCLSLISLSLRQRPIKDIATVVAATFVESEMLDCE